MDIKYFNRKINNQVVNNFKLKQILINLNLQCFSILTVQNNKI